MQGKKKPTKAELSEEDLLAKIDAIGLQLAKTRSEAMDGRYTSGIESEWLEDEEYYEGIDEANRGEYTSGAWRTKPVGKVDISTEQKNGSTVFVNITRPYCDAAAARVADMLLPTDDRAWDIRPTPIADIVPVANGQFPQEMDQTISDAFEGDQGLIAQEKAQLSQAAAAQIEKARILAEKATKRIEDWHIECQYHAHMRQVIEDASKVGTGVLKGPVPTKRKQVAYADGGLVVAQKVNPASTRIDYWNLYPDPGCGENIHNGAYIWERDDITQRQLEQLIGVPGYLPQQIIKVLKEGPSKAVNKAPERADDLPGGLRRESKNLFEIWYYYGSMRLEDLLLMGCDCGDKDIEKGWASIPVQLTMVNNRVIKVIMNPLDTGEFPYDVMVWQKRAGLPWGMGVARHIRIPQRIVNGAARNMMDNAGVAGGPQLVIKPGIVTPADGIYEIRSMKTWFVGEDADLDHLDNAFRFITAPMVQGELQNIILLGLRFAEDVTGLPMIMQGQMGQAPDTVGGMQMLSNNASSVLRRIARLFDDKITEPHISRYYSYLLQYGEDDEKGDMQVDARGSSALVERDAQSQAMAQMTALATNPMFGVDPKKWMTEFLKSQRLDPKRFAFDDEEWQQIVSNMSQPQDSSLQVAQMKSEIDQIKIQAEDQRQQQKLQVDQMRIQAEGQRQQQKMAFDADQNERDRQLELMLKDMEAQVEGIKTAMDKDTALNQLKTKLADTTMKLQVQRELSKDSQVMTPPTEPKGRAQPGQGYQA